MNWKNFKLSYKTRMGIVVFMGVLLILLGVVQKLNLIEISSELNREISFFIMIIAFAIYFSGRKKVTDAPDNSSRKNDKE